MSKERSPFCPGQPVPPGLFVGRSQQVELLRRSIGQAAAGRPEYLFITGERGIGKSSLACLGRELAEKEYGFVGAQAHLGGSETLGEVCQRLYEALVSQMPEKRLIDKVRGVFERYVESVDLFGLGVKFKRDEGSRSSLASNFLPLLAKTREVLVQEGRRGIFLIADDLNGIARVDRFANFLKSTVDQIAVTSMREFPWVLVLVGVPERMDDLRTQQPSVDRIFQPIALAPMDQTAARAFYERAFRSVNHTWEDEALDGMSQRSGGSPVIWHELGEAVFWADQDEVIGREDVFSGLMNAAEAVGRKYLQRPLYEEMRSPAYQKILGYIAASWLRGRFGTIRRADALEELPAGEAENFDNFLKRMRRLDVLRPVAGRRGEYEFTHFLFGFYVMLQSGAKGPDALGGKEKVIDT